MVSEKAVGLLRTSLIYSCIYKSSFLRTFSLPDQGYRQQSILESIIRVLIVYASRGYINLGILESHEEIISLLHNKYYPEDREKRNSILRNMSFICIFLKGIWEPSKHKKKYHNQKLDISTLANLQYTEHFCRQINLTGLSFISFMAHNLKILLWILISWDNTELF